MTNWFQSHTAFQLFQQSSGEITPILVEQGSCRCLVAVMGHGLLRRGIVQGGVAIDEHYDYATIERDLTAVLQHVWQACKQAGCIYVEMRNFADYSTYRTIFEQEGFSYQPHYDVIIPILTSAEQWNSIHESKQRWLRKEMSEQQPLTDTNLPTAYPNLWHEAQSEEEIRTFYTHLKHLYQTKVHRPIPSLDFFLTAYRTGACTFLITCDGGVMLAADDTTAYEWYICGQVMSTWAAIEWCQQHHIKYFDTMGAGKPNVPYGVRDFKLQMGGTLYDFGRFLSPIRPLIYTIGHKILG